MTTTTRLYISRWNRFLLWLHHADKPMLIGLLVLTLVLLWVGLRSWLSGLPVSSPAAPTPALSIIIATPAPPPPTAVPVQQVAAVLPNTLRGAVVAFDAPAGNVLGAIEAGRAYQLLARYGADWLQADVQGSGVVWLRASDVLELPADLADMQPPPAPVVVERPIYVSVPAPAVATPEPEQYTTAHVDAVPTLAPQQMVILDRQQWAQQRQQNIRNHYVDPNAVQGRTP